MQRFLTAALAACCVSGVGAAAAGAQQTRDSSTAAAAQLPAGSRGWNDARAVQLVRRATARRQEQLADTGLVDYRALARGYLTFLGQVGEGFTEPPRIVQATEVAVEVYWRAPNLSKQRVIGRRDTTLLPTDNDFYHDRYGIIQNNFPDVIRLGDGRDVRDVPHPLSAPGLGAYDFAVTDSLRIRVADRMLNVLELRLRPRDPAQPRLVGSLFLDVDNAQVVRMAFTFTSAAYIDKRNEDVSVVLENALVQGRFWLPRRQEIEVRRTGTFMDFPARGIIRGRWEISGYDVNQNLALAQFAGPEITFAPPAQLRRYAWEGRILDSLPADVRLVSDEDVQRVQAQARELVQAQVLQRARGGSLSARALSEFVRVNRVEGLALGAGVTRRFGNGLSATAQGRYGFADERGKGALTLRWQRASGAGIRLSGYRAYREAGDEPETSIARNSIAAQEFGGDYTDPYDVRGAAVALDLPTLRGVRPTVEIARELQGSLDVHARPFTGAYERTIPALALRATRASITFDRPTTAGPAGTELRLGGQARLANWKATGADATDAEGMNPDRAYWRLALAASVERAYGERRLVSRTTLAVVDEIASAGVIPAQDLVYLGGPTTGPGYDFHQFVGRLGATQRVEWRTPVPFPSIPLGRYGRAPASATLAPFAHAVYVRPRATLHDAPRGWFPSLGVGAFVFFDLVRLDVARGLRDGRWTFSADVTRDFWRIL